MTGNCEPHIRPDHIDADLWFSSDPDEIKAAQQICATCTIAQACFDDAISRGERDGIWGGANFSQRTHDGRRRVKTSVLEQQRAQLTKASTPVAPATKRRKQDAVNAERRARVETRNLQAAPRGDATAFFTATSDKPTVDELRRLHDAMTVTRRANAERRTDPYAYKRGRRFPDVRLQHIDHCTSCGDWRWDQRCRNQWCWTWMPQQERKTV